MAQDYRPAIKLEQLSFGSRNEDSGPPNSIQTATATFDVNGASVVSFKLALSFDVGPAGEAGVMARARLELHRFTQALAAAAPDPATT